MQDAILDILPVGQNFIEQQTLSASDGGIYKAFGWSVAVDGDTALIGTPYHGIGGQNAAYVFVRSGNVWTEQAKLTASDNLDDYYGEVVALSGDTAVIGNSIPESDTVGAAYVYVRSGNVWTEQAKLVADDMVIADRFGSTVAISGDTILVGAQRQNSDTGAVYFFTRSGTVWSQTQKITANDAFPGSAFGRNLALEGNTVLVSGRTENSTGALYVLTRNGSLWSQQARLTVDSDVEYELIESVALSGDTALVGILNGGKAHVFVRNGNVWSLETTIYVPSEVYNPFIALSVALSGDTALIGDFLGRSVHVFKRTGTTWVKTTVLRSLKAGRFGYSVALSGSTALVGDYESKEAYIFADNIHADQELLENGGFEIDANADWVPDKWVRYNPTADTRRCNKPGKPAIAYEGNCAFQFQSSPGENSSLIQEVNLTNVAGGDTLKLRGYYDASGLVNARVKVMIYYLDPSFNEKIMVKLFSPTSGYTLIARMRTLDMQPESIRVRLDNKGTSGKIRFDGFSLINTSGHSDDLIPLPAAQ